MKRDRGRFLRKAPAAMSREIKNVAKPTLMVWLRLCLDTEKILT